MTLRTTALSTAPLVAASAAATAVQNTSAPLREQTFLDGDEQQLKQAGQVRQTTALRRRGWGAAAAADHPTGARCRNIVIAAAFACCRRCRRRHLCREDDFFHERGEKGVKEANGAHL